MTLRTELRVRVIVTLARPLDLAPSLVPLNMDIRYPWSDGVGANQADQATSDHRVIPPSGTEDLDLTGSLPDGLGGTLHLARLKMLIVSGDPANAAALLFSWPALASLPPGKSIDGLPIGPAGLFVWTAPGGTAQPVPPGGGDHLTFEGTPGDGYDIVIVGASA